MTKTHTWGSLMSDDDPDLARDSVDAEMLELLERDPEAYFRLTHKPFPELATDGDMREFMRERGFLPGAWINGELWSAEEIAAANEPLNWGKTGGPARMSDEIEQLKADPDAYYKALRDEGEAEA